MVEANEGVKFMYYNIFNIVIIIVFILTNFKNVIRDKYVRTRCI
jgi:hypothetical protein